MDGNVKGLNVIVCYNYFIWGEFMVKIIVYNLVGFNKMIKGKVVVDDCIVGFVVYV